MKTLRQIVRLLKGLFTRKAKAKEGEEVETAVSRSIPLEEAYRIYKKQQRGS